MPSPKSPDEARASDIAQKSESMARELSHEREMRLRQERARQAAPDDPAPAGARPSSRKPVPRSPRLPPGSGGGAREDERGVRARPAARDTRVLPGPSASPPFYPERKPVVLDDVATELEELLRDVGLGWRRAVAADRITVAAAVLTMVGVLLPWTSDASRGAVPGIVMGGGLHAALAVTAIALSVRRGQQLDPRGERLSGPARRARARRTSLWHLLLGSASTLLCGYFLVVYGLQRDAVPGLEIRYGLYVTLAAGMGLSYGGFARFFARTHDEWPQAPSGSRGVAHE